jgi:protein-disulfide isomerase
MNKLKWIIFAVVVVGIFGGIIWISKSNNTSNFTGDAAHIINAAPIADHVLGVKTEKVTLIEYGDYQCPGCGKMYQPVHDITEKYKDKITFVFRHMPLTNVHPNALAAATAAEAAGLQGKYYEIHDMLYQSQAAWSDASVSKRGEIFQNYASQLGLDATKFKNDLSSKDITEKINRDRTTGQNQFKVDSTPTFVLDGKKVDSAIATDADALGKLIDDAIARAYPPVATTE